MKIFSEGETGSNGPDPTDKPTKEPPSNTDNLLIIGLTTPAPRTEDKARTTPSTPFTTNNNKITKQPAKTPSTSGPTQSTTTEEPPEQAPRLLLPIAPAVVPAVAPVVVPVVSAGGSAVASAAAAAGGGGGGGGAAAASAAAGIPWGPLGLLFALGLAGGQIEAEERRRVAPLIAVRKSYTVPPPYYYRMLDPRAFVTFEGPEMRPPPLTPTFVGPQMPASRVGSGHTLGSSLQNIVRQPQDRFFDVPRDVGTPGGLELVGEGWGYMETITPEWVDVDISTAAGMNLYSRSAFHDAPVNEEVWFPEGSSGQMNERMVGSGTLQQGHNGMIMPNRPVIQNGGAVAQRQWQVRGNLPTAQLGSNRQAQIMTQNQHFLHNNGARVGGPQMNVPGPLINLPNTMQDFDHSHTYVRSNEGGGFFELPGNYQASSANARGVGGKFVQNTNVGGLRTGSIRNVNVDITGANSRGLEGSQNLGPNVNMGGPRTNIGIINDGLRGDLQMNPNRVVSMDGRADTAFLEFDREPGVIAQRKTAYTSGCARKLQTCKPAYGNTPTLYGEVSILGMICDIECNNGNRNCPADICVCSCPKMDLENLLSEIEDILTHHHHKKNMQRSNRQRANTNRGGSNSNGWSNNRNTNNRNSNRSQSGSSRWNG